MTTWPTPRDHLMWGTRELHEATQLIDANDDTVQQYARDNGRRLQTVRGRIVRLRQLRDEKYQGGER